MGLYDADGFEYHEGVVKTPLDCHDCSKQFVAKLDYDMTGNHIIICPYCGHQHCRTIKDGVVTGDRWDHRYENVDCTTERVWSHKTLPMETTTAAEHIRKRWLT